MSTGNLVRCSAVIQNTVQVCGGDRCALGLGDNPVGIYCVAVLVAEVLDTLDGLAAIVLMGAGVLARVLVALPRYFLQHCVGGGDLGGSIC